MFRKGDLFFLNEEGKILFRYVNGVNGIIMSDPYLLYEKDFESETPVLEYYGYDNLANYSGDWGNVASKLDSVLDIYHSMEDKSLSGHEVVAYKRQMYVDKTLNYHNELINDFDFFKCYKI